MSTRYEHYTDKYKRRRSELPYREVRRANLDRVGKFVLRSMDVAGETPFPEKWNPMLEQINMAYSENPEHLVLILWRVLCNFSVRSEEKEVK